MTHSSGPAGTTDSRCTKRSPWMKKASPVTPKLDPHVRTTERKDRMMGEGEINDGESHDPWDPIDCEEGAWSLNDAAIPIEDLYAEQEGHLVRTKRSFLRLARCGGFEVLQSTGINPGINLHVFTPGPAQGLWRFRYLPKDECVQIHFFHAVERGRRGNWTTSNLASITTLSGTVWRTTPTVELMGNFGPRLARTVAKAFRLSSPIFSEQELANTRRLSPSALTVSEAASLLGSKAETVSGLILEGRLEAIRSSGRLWVERSDVEMIIAEGGAEIENGD
jgi:excisionase family DNA binding protein